MGIRTKDAHNKVIKYSTRESGHDQKKTLTPAFAPMSSLAVNRCFYRRCSKYTHTHTHAQGNERNSIQTQKKKKNDDGYRGGFPATYVSQTQRAGHTHMRGNMRLNIAPNRFYGQTEKSTRVHKDKREFAVERLQKSSAVSFHKNVSKKKKGKQRRCNAKFVLTL